MYNGSCNDTPNQVLLNYIAAVANSPPEQTSPEDGETPANPNAALQVQLNGSDVTNEIGTIPDGSGLTTEEGVMQEENLAGGSDCAPEKAVNETINAESTCELDSLERPAPTLEYEALSPTEPASEQDCEESMESATHTLLNILDATSCDALLQESEFTETAGEPTSQPAQSQNQSVIEENPVGPRRSKRVTRPVLNFGLLDDTSQAVEEALVNSLGFGTSTSGSARSRSETGTSKQSVASPRRRSQRTPNETFPCGTCGKVFYSLSNLRQHSLVHDGDKKYACGVCGKMFRFLPNLYDHKTIHEENADVHQCPLCEKKCRLKGNLKKHFRVHYKKDADLEAAWQMFSKIPDSRSTKKEPKAGSSSIAAQESEDEEESTVERAFLQNVPRLATVSQRSTPRKRKPVTSRAPEASHAVDRDVQQEKSLNGDLEVKEETAAAEPISNQTSESSYELRKRSRRSAATAPAGNGRGGTPTALDDACASSVVRDFLERAPRLNREVAHSEGSPPPALSPQDATGSTVLQDVKMEEDEAAASTATPLQEEPEDNSRNRTHLNGHTSLSVGEQSAGRSQGLSQSSTRQREGGSASKELLVQLSVARAQIHELKQTIAQKDELIEKERLRREKLVADHKWELAKKDVELASLRRQLVATQDGESSSSSVTDAERLLEMEKELQARDALIARLMISNNSS